MLKLVEDAYTICCVSLCSSFVRSTCPKHLIVTIDLPGLVREYRIIGNFEIVKQALHWMVF